ncbi:MAG: hypothetical protein ACFFBC_09145 [Promethearchaeota archaeon]
MSLEELISIERIENYRKSRIKETYSVDELNLSSLFIEVVDKVEKSNLPLLDMHILLYSLKFIPFTNEVEGLEIFETLKECMNYELHGKSSQWCCKRIAHELEKLCNLIAYDYLIEGSLIVYYNYEIEWDLSVSIIPPS